jgi:primosomal protein N' (replication factor Y) (superfamily II helicase)
VQTCSVIPLTRLDKELGYRIPEALAGRVEVGCLVRVPIGPRSELGLVARLGDDGSFPAERMKFLHALEQPFPVLTPGLLRLADWMRRYSAAGLGDILEVMIPAPARKGMRPQERVFIRLERRLPPTELEALRRRAPQQARIHDFLADQLEGLQLARPELLQRLQVPA